MDDSPQQDELTRREALKQVSGGTGAAVSGMTLSQVSASSAGEPVALQYFHKDWTTIKDNMNSVADWGFDAIWIQQPAEAKRTEESQEDDDNDGVGEPTLGYQPIDLTNFNSEMGTESELQTLINRAHDNGVDVIVDTVMNHMANASASTFPQFEDKHFHDVYTRDWPSINKESKYGQIPQGAYSFDSSNEKCYKNGDTNGEPKDPYEYECDPYLVENAELLGLRDLDQGDPYVREQLKNYVDKIASLGADGYRFDAAKHMAEDFFANYANQWAEDNGMFRVGEVFDGNPRYLLGYANAGPGMMVFDFSLFYTMQSVFSGGNMEKLEGAGLIDTDPFKSMPFVENHDVTAPSQYDLAHAFMLTSEGYPMLYNPDPDWLLGYQPIKNMVWVKKNLAGGETSWLFTDNDLAIYERGSNLLVGLNNSGGSRTQSVTTSLTNTELKDYSGTGSKVTTDASGNVDITVPEEGWVFYAPAALDIDVSASGETGVSRGGEATVSISADEVEQIVIEDIWIDWSLGASNGDGGTITDDIAGLGSVTVDYDSRQTTVSPSIDISLPKRYVGGEYRLTVTVTNSDGESAETTATVSVV
jgi:alpha-amylase